MAAIPDLHRMCISNCSLFRKAPDPTFYTLTPAARLSGVAGVAVGAEFAPVAAVSLLARGAIESSGFRYKLAGIGEAKENVKPFKKGE